MWCGRSMEKLHFMPCMKALSLTYLRLFLPYHEDNAFPAHRWRIPLATISSSDSLAADDDSEQQDFQEVGWLSGLRLPPNHSKLMHSVAQMHPGCCWPRPKGWEFSVAQTTQQANCLDSGPAWNCHRSHSVIVRRYHDINQTFWCATLTRVEPHNVGWALEFPAPACLTICREPLVNQ